MKKQRIRILSYFLIFMLLSSMVMKGAIISHADSIYIIRIGLTNQLKQQDKVKISTKKIALGYCVNNYYSEYLHFESKNGFTLTPATGYYLVSDTVYTSYNAVQKACNKAKKVSAAKKHVYISMCGKNKWRVYAGGLSDVAKVSSWQYSLEQKVGSTFGAVTSYNGHRVLLKGANDAIIYDGADTDQYVQIAPNVLNKKGSKTLTVNGYEYRGRMEIAPFGSTKLTVVNIMNVENYLRSVVGSEMSQSTSMEAQRAQAIVSRTYAQNRCDNTGDTNITMPYQINDTATYQKYGGYSKENAKSVEAVTSTRGICIYSGGEQIQSRFFISSGGVTESSFNVWGSNAAYLQSVSDTQELAFGRGPWQYSYTGEELGAKLGVGTVTGITIDKVTSSYRVMQITVTGTEKSITLKGENITQKLGLPSCKFTMQVNGENPEELSLLNSEGSVVSKNLKGLCVVSGKGKVSTLNGGNYVVLGNSTVKNYVTDVPSAANVYQFSGMGEGNGVGMSQAGAKAMAQKGATYQQILKYYYGKGITIR